MSHRIYVRSFVSNKSSGKNRNIRNTHDIIRNLLFVDLALKRKIERVALRLTVKNSANNKVQEECDTNGNIVLNENA